MGSRDVRIRMTAVGIRHAETGWGWGHSPRQKLPLPPLFPSEGQRNGIAHAPSNKILHSRLCLFESSSIWRSIKSERAFPSTSWLFEAQFPISVDGVAGGIYAILRSKAGMRAGGGEGEVYYSSS
jgi:hypothetical protein